MVLPWFLCFHGDPLGQGASSCWIWHSPVAWLALQIIWITLCRFFYNFMSLFLITFCREQSIQGLVRDSVTWRINQKGSNYRKLHRYRTMVSSEVFFFKINPELFVLKSCLTFSRKSKIAKSLRYIFNWPKLVYHNSREQIQWNFAK